MSPDAAGPSALTSRRRHLVRLSAAVASREDGGAADVSGEIDRAARAVRSGELEQREVEEALLQSHLFLGYPAALSALAAWRERVPEPPPETDPLAGPGAADARRERGEETCRRVYGRAYDKLRDRVGSLHPALDRWMVSEGYGKVLARPGLPLVDRELCIAAVLAVLGHGPQLHSHVRGALRAGAEPEAVEETLAVALRWADRPGRRRTARDVWREVRGRGDTAGA